MSTSPTYHGPEILAAVERALRKVQDGQNKAATVEVVGETVVITPETKLDPDDKTYLSPGQKLDSIMAELDEEFGETFKALSK